MQPKLKKYLPFLWITIGFALISFLYCLPQLQGKKLNAHDGISWEGAAHQIRAYEDSTGIHPLWSNSMFGGMPTYTIYTGGIKNYVIPAQTLIEKVIPNPASLFFFAMLGFFVLSCSLRINKWIGAIGAIAYAFATYNPIIISVGHVTKMYGIGFLPGVLAGFLMIFNGRRLAGAAVMGLFFTLMVSWNHYQMVYYTGIVLLIAAIGIGINEIRNGRLKNFVISGLIAAVVGVLSVGPSLPTVLTTREYTEYTMRGGTSELKAATEGTKKNGGLDKEYAFRWSNGFGETFCLMIPMLYGGASGQDLGTGSKFYETLTSVGYPEQYAEQYAAQAPTYWGPQPFLSGPVYFGAIICFLFVLGLIIIRSAHKWWIAAACLLAILMSLGRHLPALNYFLFDHLPMYNKFRTPSMILVIPQLLFPMLAVWALNDVLTEKISGEQLWKKVKTATIITAGLCLLLGVGGQMFFDFRSENDTRLAAQFAQSAGNNPAIGNQLVKALQEDRASMAMKSGLTSACFILAAAGLIWAYNRKKIKKEILLAGIGVLVVADLIPIATRYLSEKNFQDASEYESVFEPRPVDTEIMKDPDPYYRVLDISKDTYNDAVQAYFHKSIGGYSPAKMESYQDLIDVHMSRTFNTEVLNMLNTKYIIFNGGPNNQPVFQPNPAACGNAWFVSELSFVPTAAAEMSAMNASVLGDTSSRQTGWKAANTAIIREQFRAQIGTATHFERDSSSSIKLDKYGLNDISFVSANAHEGFAVFSDIYYDKGWKAFIDGKETPIVKVNYVLRGLKIPAGQHKIEFRFHPDSFYKGNTVAMISSILLYLLFGAALYLAFRSPRTTAVQED